MNHSEARALVSTLPGLTPAQSLVLRSVALHETRYGQGWDTPEKDAANNMGAITTSRRTAEGGCVGTDFANKDSMREGAGGVGGNILEYETCFASDPTPRDGFDRLRRTLYESKAQSDDKKITRGPAMVAAAQQGLGEVARVMRETKYYLGTAATKPAQIEAYRSALDKAARTIVAATGEAWPWGGGAVPLVLTLLAAGLGAVAITRALR